MSIPRRDFLKSSLALSATAVLGVATGSAASVASAPAVREYYDLRCYRLKPSAPSSLVEKYLEQALFPALKKQGLQNLGAFTEVEIDKATATSKPKVDTPVWVLIPHPTLESFVKVSAEINQDPSVQQAGAEYLQVDKAKPSFDRIDSWLLLAFRSMPKLELPKFSKDKVATRLFEMRDYESHSELKALNKMAMFDEGETQLMRDLGMSPVFFGQALSGPNLPHLRYMTSCADLATHLGNWKKFGSDPRWSKMKVDPRWTGNTSKNTARFLIPTSYSEI